VPQARIETGERLDAVADIAEVTLESGLHAVIRDDLFTPGSYLLVVDGTPQSHVDPARPTELFFEYISRMGHVVDQLPAGPLTALHLGAGALTMPRYVEATRPGSRRTTSSRRSESTTPTPTSRCPRCSRSTA